MDILIIGHGFVGSAVAYGFENCGNTIRIIDSKHSSTTLDTAMHDWDGWSPDFTFVCLPTPTVDGRCDITLIESTLIRHKQLYPYSQIVIKSTMTPDCIQRLTEVDDSIIYNPEFLRAATALQDYIKPDLCVYGGDPERCRKLIQLYQDHSHISGGKTITCSWEVASMMKYAVNTFLAMKVAWANEMAEILAASESTWDWNTFQHALGHEPRIGSSHMQVPGPDGQPGFGGACFPKDTEALQGYADLLQVDHTILTSVIESNKQRRGS